jgi:DNA-binding NtrC family response regulator
MCQRGDFREDLYFRLAVMRIHMPPLRDHPEDIEKLAYLFLQEKGMELSKRVYGFSDDVLSFFRRYSWPGNVRELKNMVERLIILADSDVIQLDESSLRRYCFMGDVAPGLPELASNGSASAAKADSQEDFQVRPLEEVEKDYLCRALRHLRFNKSKCARELGISRSTLQRKIAVYGLEEWIERQQQPAS